MQETERESLIEKIILISSLKEGIQLTSEEENRIGNASWKLGKTFSEETEIEISGLIEERVGREVRTKIENLKITRRVGIELLAQPPDKNREE